MLEPANRLNATFAALADPTRRAILARLAQGEASVSSLAEPFAISLPAISKHLKVLEHAGLITRGRDAQMRPCRIDTTGFLDVDHWLNEYRKLWEQSMDRLESYLDELKAEQVAASAAPLNAESVNAGPVKRTGAKGTKGNKHERKE